MQIILQCTHAPTDTAPDGFTPAKANRPVNIAEHDYIAVKADVTQHKEVTIQNLNTNQKSSMSVSKLKRCYKNYTFKEIPNGMLLADVYDIVYYVSEEHKELYLTMIEGITVCPDNRLDNIIYHAVYVSEHDLRFTFMLSQADFYNHIASRDIKTAEAKLKEIKTAAQTA